MNLQSLTASINADIRRIGAEIRFARPSRTNWTKTCIPSGYVSGSAKMPTRVKNSEIQLYPWHKTCVSSYWMPSRFR